MGGLPLRLQAQQPRAVVTPRLARATLAARSNSFSADRRDDASSPFEASSILKCSTPLWRERSAQLLRTILSYRSPSPALRPASGASKATLRKATGARAVACARWHVADLEYKSLMLHAARVRKLLGRSGRNRPCVVGEVPLCPRQRALTFTAALSCLAVGICVVNPVGARGPGRQKTAQIRVNERIRATPLFGPCDLSNQPITFLAPVHSSDRCHRRWRAA